LLPSRRGHFRARLPFETRRLERSPELSARGASWRAPDRGACHYSISLGAHRGTGGERSVNAVQLLGNSGSGSAVRLA
jgi:hypothetical protein